MTISHSCGRYTQFFLLFLISTLARTQDITVTPFASLQTESKKDVTALVVSNSARSLLVGDSKGNVHYIDFDKRQTIAGLKLKYSIIFADLLSENKTAVGVDKRGNIAVFDLFSGHKLRTFKTGSKPLQATIDAGKRFVAVATAIGARGIVSVSIAAAERERERGHHHGH